jgi:hypothetical protein
MKVGDIAYLKSYKSMVGEVLKIEDNEVTLALCDTGLEIIVDMEDLE